MRSVFFPRLVNGPFGDPGLFVRIAHRRQALLFDCGDLHSLPPRDLLKIREVYLSHAHIDHLIGFDTLLRQFLYQDQGPTFFGPPGILGQIKNRLQSYTWNLISGYPLVVRVREWGKPRGREGVFRAKDAFRLESEDSWDCRGGLCSAAGHYRVRAVPLDHGGIISLAFVLEEPLHIGIHKDALERCGFLPGPWLTCFKDRLRAGLPGDTPIRVPLVDGGEKTMGLNELSAGIAHTERGMKVAYVTDAAPTESNLEKIVDLAQDAHLLVIEATFLHADLDRARERNHLTARLAGTLARRARVARLQTFHHSPRYLDCPERVGKEAEAAFMGGEPESAGRTLAPGDE